MNFEIKDDLLNLSDVKIVVDKFYDKIKTDDLLAPLFSHVNWPEHLPVMYRFWSSMLLGEQSYRGNPLMKHLPLPLTRAHFDRWILLFTETVDELFHGEKADEMKMRAITIASVFQVKMGLTTNPAKSMVK